MNDNLCPSCGREYTAYDEDLDMCSDCASAYHECPVCHTYFTIQTGLDDMDSIVDHGACLLCAYAERVARAMISHYGREVNQVLAFYTLALHLYHTSALVDAILDAVDAWLIDQETVPSVPTLAEVVTWDEDL